MAGAAAGGAGVVHLNALRLDGERATDGHSKMIVHRHCIDCGANRFSDREWTDAVGASGGSAQFRIGTSATSCNACSRKRVGKMEKMEREKSGSGENNMWTPEEAIAIAAVRLPVGYAPDQVMRQVATARNRSSITFMFAQVKPLKVEFTRITSMAVSVLRDGKTVWSLDCKSDAAKTNSMSDVKNDTKLCRWWSEHDLKWVNGDEGLKDALVKTYECSSTNLQVSYELSNETRLEMAKHYDLSKLSTREQVIHKLNGVLQHGIVDYSVDSNGLIKTLTFGLTTWDGLVAK